MPKFCAHCTGRKHHQSGCESATYQETNTIMAEQDVAAEAPYPHEEHEPGFDGEVAEPAGEMSRATELALKALALATVAKRVAAAREVVDAELKRVLEQGDSKKPMLPGSTVRLGAVSYAKGAVSATVLDDKAFTDWVTRNYPSEVEMVVRVQPGFINKVLNISKAAEQAVGPGGELDIPGVVVKTSTQGNIRVAPDAKVSDEMWRAIWDKTSTVGLESLIEIEAGYI